MNVRKLNILFHRYVGYFFFGLTIVYSVSGFTLNHLDDWNPNYVLNNKKIEIEPIKNKEELSEAEGYKIFYKLDIYDKNFNSKNVFYPSEDTIQVVLGKDKKIIIDTKKNTANYEYTSRRPIFNALNFLHRNKIKKAWTYYADFFCIALLLIAISGMFMKKGPEGVWGKGGVIALAGMIAPLAFILIYY
ncbi:MAG: PepSY-associated TM helix domain-containing protein [Candidatus Sericytochromatia bacterium]